MTVTLKYFNDLRSINDTITQQKFGTMEYQKNVELIQIGLVLLGYELLSFNGDKQLTSVSLRNVKTKEEMDLPVEGAFVFIGQIPESSFVKDLGITNKWGNIEVNEKSLINKIIPPTETQIQKK